MLGKISRRIYRLTHNALVVISPSVSPPALFLGKLPADNQYSSAKLSTVTDKLPPLHCSDRDDSHARAYSNTSFQIWSRIHATIFAILLPTDTGAEDHKVPPGCQMSFLEREELGHVRAGTGPRRAVGNVSGNRCESDFRSRGREFDPGPVPYFPAD